MSRATRYSILVYEKYKASVAFKAQALVATSPKPAKPSIAAFNATEAATIAVGRQYVASLPSYFNNWDVYGNHINN
ncbi:hypothetical protein HPULCUR_004699 [Helicostylum pulchrum]|uniref:Uncharacterized protein n=1 Tax=Helicostylum pulchrum TaxID=562976 RepID=A0ABP9XWY3_9FUNG